MNKENATKLWKLIQESGDCLNKGYKITKEELVKFDRSANKIFTLKKGRNVKVCTVKVNAFGVSRNSRCMTP